MINEDAKDRNGESFESKAVMVLIVNMIFVASTIHYKLLTEVDLCGMIGPDSLIRVSYTSHPSFFEFMPSFTQVAEGNKWDL